jgi:hypothetical protein
LGCRARGVAVVVKHVLEDGETMAQRRRQEQRDIEDARVLRAIRKRAGQSKAEIATSAGLTETQVACAIARLNEPGPQLVAYGVFVDHGESIRGWHPVDRKRLGLITQEGAHLMRVAAGLRRAHLVKWLQAKDTPHAEHVVTALERQLDVNVETMPARDLETFEELLAESVGVT